MKGRLFKFISMAKSHSLIAESDGIFLKRNGSLIALETKIGTFACNKILI